jgi:hypothetical protein
VAGAALPLCVALLSRDKALRGIGLTTLKYVVVMPLIAAGLAVGLIFAVA